MKIESKVGSEIWKRRLLCLRNRSERPERMRYLDSKKSMKNGRVADKRFNYIVTSLMKKPGKTTKKLSPRTKNGSRKNLIVQIM